MIKKFDFGCTLVGWFRIVWTFLLIKAFHVSINRSLSFTLPGLVFFTKFLKADNHITFTSNETDWQTLVGINHYLEANVSTHDFSWYDMEAQITINFMSLTG